MNAADAEEYTQALGQVVAGSWRQVALGKRLGVPRALGLTTREWVEDRLGGYVRLSIEERREAVAELTGDGMTQRETAEVLGVDVATVNRDVNPVANATDTAPDPASPPAEPVADATADEDGRPLDAFAALAADEQVRRQAEKAQRRAQDGHMADDWYTPRWLFEQMGVIFDIDVCAPTDPALRTVPARRYYTAADDGLTQPWEGMIWCNPPYSASEEWAQRWAAHDNGMLLLFVAAKNTRMVEHWAAAQRMVLFSGMIFDRPDSNAGGSLYLPLTLLARGPAGAYLQRVQHTWASPVLERVA